MYVSGGTSSACRLSHQGWGLRLNQTNHGSWAPGLITGTAIHVPADHPDLVRPVHEGLSGAMHLF